MKKILFSLVLLLAVTTADAAQKTVTVGTSGSKASLDLNFGNIHDNFTELFGRLETPPCTGDGQTWEWDATAGEMVCVEVTPILPGTGVEFDTETTPGSIILNFTGGGLSWDDVPTYEDSAHDSGLAVDATTLYVHNGTKWMTLSLTDSLDPAPIIPTISSATISGSGGDIFTLGFSTAVTQGSGWNVADLTLSCASAGSLTATYTSGNTTDTHVFGLSAGVYGTDTCTYSWAGTANGLESSTGDDLASVTDGAVANESGLTASGAHIEDDFNRAAGALGGLWAYPKTADGAYANPVINSSGAVRPGVTNRLGLAYYNTTWSDDHKTCVTVVTAIADTAEWGGAGARMVSGQYQGYFIRAYNGSYELLKVVAGVPTLLATYGSHSAGTQICVSAVGSTITATIGGVGQTPVTDTSLTTGSSGIITRNYFAVDNFTGDEL